MLSLQYRLLFSHRTEHVTFWRVDCRLRSLKHPPITGPRLLRVMTTQKYFTLGAGPAFCGSVNNSCGSNTMSFKPGSPIPSLSLHFLSYQQTEKWNTTESTGVFLCSTNMKCTYCFPPHSQWEPPKPLLRNDEFTRLCMHFYVYHLTVKEAL